MPSHGGLLCRQCGTEGVELSNKISEYKRNTILNVFNVPVINGLYTILNSYGMLLSLQCDYNGHVISAKE